MIFKENFIVSRKVKLLSDSEIRDFIKRYKELNKFFCKYEEFCSYKSLCNLSYFKENLYSNILDRFSANQSLSDDIDIFTHTELLIKGINKFQNQKIQLFDYVKKLIQDEFINDNDFINYKSFVVIFEIIQEMFDSYEYINKKKLSLKDFINLNFKSKLTSSLKNYSSTRYSMSFAQSVRNLAQNWRASDFYNLHNIDKLLILHSNTITDRSLKASLITLNDFINKEHLILKDKYKSKKNIISIDCNDLTKLVLKNFSRRNRNLLIDRFGLYGNDRHTIKEILVKYKFINLEEFLIKYINILNVLSLSWSEFILDEILF